MNDSKTKEKIPGTFVAARKIRNEGIISSEGPEARTEVISEDYKGSGIIKSKITQPKTKEKWYQKWWGQLLLGIVITVISGLILVFFL